MENLNISITISVIYFFIKFFELRFEKNNETKPLKNILKDCFFVFLASFCGLFIINQFISKNSSDLSNTAAFLDNPEF